MNWFYTPEISRETQEYTLSPDESKHACKVLRLKIGDEISLLNGQGYSFTGEIIDDNTKACSIKIKSFTFEEKSPYEIHIAIAPTKNSDRIEWFIEKATEIGISKISLILCKNSERKSVKEERYHKILVSAMKQSQQKYLPQLNPLIDLKDFLSKYKRGAVAYCFSGNKMNLKNTIEKRDYPVLIGPEGDFTKEEVELILANGFDPITLGKSRLRTETAGLYACINAKLIFEQ